MSYQTTLERTLEMMLLLTNPGGWKLQDLADRFEMSVRTIQRTIATLKMAGYYVENINGRYKLNREEIRERNGFDIGDLVHFTREESWMLNEAFKNLPGSNAVKDSLMRKLLSVYDSDSAVKRIIEENESTVVRIIYNAIRDKKQIIISEYTRSTTNNGIRSVIAEPLSFASDFTRVWTYLPGLGKNILLRVSGLAGVKASNEPYKHEKHHKVGIMDAFRSYGFKKNKKIVLTMNIRAYGYLCDEYPMAKPFITQTGKREYKLNIKVCNFTQISRFYRGLPGDIEIIESDEFKEYLNMDKKQQALFSAIDYPIPY